MALASPAWPAGAWPLVVGCDAPTGSVLLGRFGPFVQGSPKMAGSVPLRAVLARGQSGLTCTSVAEDDHMPKNARCAHAGKSRW